MAITKEQVEARIYEQLTELATIEGAVQWSNLPEDEQRTRLSQLWDILQSDIDTAENGLVVGALNRGAQSVELGFAIPVLQGSFFSLSVMGEGLERSFRFALNPSGNIEAALSATQNYVDTLMAFRALDENARGIVAERAAEAWQQAHSANQAEGFSFDRFFFAFTSAIKFGIPPFSMDAFNSAWELHDDVEEAAAVGNAMQTAIRQLEPELASDHVHEVVRSVTRLNSNGRFIPGMMPSYLETDAAAAQRFSRYYEAQDALLPPEQSIVQQGISWAQENPGRAALATGGAVTGAILMRHTAANMAAGAVLDVPNAIGSRFKTGYVAVASTFGDDATKLAAQFEMTRLLQTRAQRIGQVSDLPFFSRAGRHAGRLLGISTTVFGSLPIIGGIVNSAESVWYATVATRAYAAGDLNDNQYAAVLGALGTHGITGFGGFLAEGVDQSVLMTLEQHGLGEYAPTSIVQFASEFREAISERGDGNQAILQMLNGSLDQLNPEIAANYIYDLERPDYVNQQRLPAYGRAIYSERHDLVRRFAQLYDRMQSNPTSAESREFDMVKNHPVMTAFKDAILSNEGYSDITDIDAFIAQLGRRLKTDQEYRAAIEINSIQNYYDGNLYRAHATNREIYNDLFHRGPIYQRWYQASFMAGQDMNDFTREITSIMRVLETELTHDRADQLFALPHTGYFGTTQSSHYVSLATKNEWDRYDANLHAVERMFAQLNSASEQLASDFNKIHTAYFLSSEAPTAGNMQLALQHNHYLRDWIQNHYGDNRLENMIAELGRMAPDTVYADHPEIEAFTRHINGEGREAYEAAVKAALQPLATRYTLLEPLFANQTPVEQAILMSYLIPQAETVTRPSSNQRDALIESARQVRSAADAFSTREGQYNDSGAIAYFRALGKFSQQLQTAATRQSEPISVEMPSPQTAESAALEAGAPVRGQLAINDETATVSASVDDVVAGRIPDGLAATRGTSTVRGGAFA